MSCLAAAGMTTRRRWLVGLTRAGVLVATVTVLAACHLSLPGADPTTTHATSKTSAGKASGPNETGGGASVALAALPVKGRAPMTGYSRNQFGQAWTDDVTVDGGRNGCGTRDDILRRSMTKTTLKPGTHGCVVLSGTLADPYTGKTISFVRGPNSAAVQIDHVVAEGDAWQTGAQQLTLTQRTNMANDPLELLAVDGRANQQKSDSDAASWLPQKSFRCSYVARQIAVKKKYHLWVTAAEKAAMVKVLAACPTQTLPTDNDVRVPAPAK